MASPSVVTENYLKSLYAGEERGEPALGVSDLAKRMDVTASTASETVRRLKKEGLVDHAPYQKVRLTKKGRLEALGVIRRHRVLETYLYEKLGFEWDEVHREADSLEHVISDTLLDRMDQVLGRPQRDPHGDPIPQLDADYQPPRVRELDAVPKGQEALVARVSDDEPALLRHLESLGVVPDAKIRVVERLGFAGLLRVKITPPADWHPRNAAGLHASVAPGQESSFDLGDMAVQAIWVSDQDSAS